MSTTTHDHDDDAILDLSKLAPIRKEVRFEPDGPLHKMATPEMMSLDDRAEVFRLQNLQEKLGSKVNPSKQDREKMKAAVDQAARLVLPDMTDAEFATVSDFHREAVVVGFMTAFGATMSKLVLAVGGGREETPETPETTDPSTTES